MVYYSSYVCCNIGVENHWKSNYKEETPQTQMSGASCPYFLTRMCVFYLNHFGVQYPQNAVPSGPSVANPWHVCFDAIVVYIDRNKV